MQPQTVGAVTTRQKLGLTLRGLGLWHLAFGLPFLAAVFLTIRQGSDAVAEAELGLLAALIVGGFSTFWGLLFEGISCLLLGRGFLKSPWLLTLGAGLVGTLIAGFLLFSAPGEVVGVLVAYGIATVTLGEKPITSGWQARAQEQCKNCGKRLTVNDKLRNHGTGLCWECFVASPEARTGGREKVSERIQLLARLRDEGLITNEEFESKSADLLCQP